MPPHVNGNHIIAGFEMRGDMVEDTCKSCDAMQWDEGLLA